jgi:hypothetical protein
MRTITFFLLVILIIGCYKEHPDKYKPIDKDKTVSVIDFGANGFDLIDDSQAFIEALNSSGKVNVDTGKFIINNTAILSDHNKLIGDGIPDRYNREIKGTSIVAGTTVKKIFQLEGFGNEIQEMLITGHWGKSPYGDSLETVISIGYGGGKNKLNKLAFRDIPSDYTCIEFTSRSNTNYITQCYFMGGEWGIYTRSPQYGLHIQGCTFWKVGNGIFLNRATEGFSISECFFDNIAGPSVQLDTNTWWLYKFENIFVEWAWPLILTGTASRPVIAIDGLFGVGDETKYIIELHCDATITIRNAVLYGLSGWKDDQDFPILNYEQYKHNIKLENVKIMKYQSSRDFKVWNKDFNE